MTKQWRKAIQPYQRNQRKKYFIEHITNDSYEYEAKSKNVKCCECNLTFKSGKVYSIYFKGGNTDLHMDHITPLSHLVKDFARSKRMNVEDIEKYFWKYESEWIVYHNDNAVIKPIHKNCHKWKTREQQQQNIF